MRWVIRSKIHQAAVTEANVEYISIADPETLQELSRVDNRSLVSLAVYIDDVRLIDNMILG